MNASHVSKALAVLLRPSFVSDAIRLAALLLAVTATVSYGGSASWQLNPTSGDWNTTANWMPNTIPNGPADVATFNLSHTTEVGVSANTTVDTIAFQPSADPFTVTVTASRTLTVTGLGINNNSGRTQNFVIEVDSVGNQGLISFNNSATAGALTFFLNKGSIGNTGSNEGGRTEFYDSSSAGSGTFVSTAAVPGGVFGGEIKFFNDSTAGEASFIAEGGDYNGGRIRFFDSSNASDGTFTMTGGNVDGGTILFLNGSSAGRGTFTVNGGESAGGGECLFFSSSTAAEGVFTINGTETSGGAGGILTLLDSTTAADATLVVNGGRVTGAQGGRIVFSGDSTSGNATIIINGDAGHGGDCLFADEATGGTGRVEVFGNGSLTVFSQNRRVPLALGSVEGDGLIILSSPVSIGGNNLSTVFSGVMDTFGPLIKVGTGTLTLTGDNTYRGGTAIESGGLVIDNATGSGTGTGDVSVTGGTLAGGGTIAGRVVVGTGSGTGAVLAPGKGASTLKALTFQNTLTFKADSTYSCRLNTKRRKSDQVVANGITIESGAQFEFQSIGNQRLRPGKAALVLSNTAATPIAGEFANLADGSTFTSGRTNFQVSYSGGDGNDLTLTVLP